MTETADDRDLEETKYDETPGLEPDDDEEQGEADAETPPAPEPPSSEAVLKKADAANRRYHKQLDSILGAKSGHIDCPTCEGLGIVWDDGKPAADFVHPDNLEACGYCNGYGQVISGSKNPDHQLVVCIKCNGLGYVTKAAQPANVTQLPAPMPTPDQPIGGQYVPGRGFIPYGATEPLPGTNIGGG